MQDKGHLVVQGIAPNRPRLFDSFFRVDKFWVQPGSDGAGVGLFITRAIMDGLR